ncbi:MAG: hypothetical protein JO336_17945 [Acidobacteriia bacterium]|nr:hypothetical protein [Terriglobia bacterium]MBV9743523.1 hypothetical protein [Terriglobia bacterium]
MPFDAGLCASCAHARTITSDRGSKFLLCMLSKTDPRYPKYPRLPVLECEGWIPRNFPPPSPVTQSGDQ